MKNFPYFVLLLLLMSCQKTGQRIEHAGESKNEHSSLDSDGDGLTDFEEIKIYKTRPDLKDSDSDQISDGIEVKQLKTNPLKIDSNDDGFPDSIYSTESKDLAVIVNSQDPLSAQIAHYYQAARSIPSENIIQVSFDPSLTSLKKETFTILKQSIDEQTPEHVQFYALTWANTYRVECTSITSAITFGYSEELGRCDKSCSPTQWNPYFADNIFRPYSELKIRPSMMLAASDFESAKMLIDRGVAADLSQPYQKHQAFLLQTSDKTRSVRKRFFNQAKHKLGAAIHIEIQQTDSITGKDNIMFYFTGLRSVSGLEENRFLPGAIGDHLTSFGGMLTNSTHMSAMRWLEAGATGSYGTVIEPCAYLEKFPNPIPLMSHYLNGATLIEAYWKSVEMPGQGVFIGEPLSRPYASNM